MHLQRQLYFGESASTQSVLAYVARTLERYLQLQARRCQPIGKTFPLITFALSDHVFATNLQKTHYRTVDQLGQEPQQDVNGTKPVPKLKPHMSDL